MAKKKYPFLQVAPEGYVLVNSATYGRHLRAKRGTKTPVALNETMKQYGQVIGERNLMASRFRRAIVPLAGNFVNGQLWPELLSRFSSCYKEHGRFAWQALQGFEINKNYPFERFGIMLNPAWVRRDEEDIVHVDISKINVIDPVRLKFERYSLQLFFLLGVQEDFEVRKIAIDVTDNGIRTGGVAPVIQHGGEILVIVKMEGVKDGRIEDALQYSGMSVAEVIGEGEWHKSH